MDTRELIDRLRCRYPAARSPMPGPWTTLVEYAGIDVLAFCAWQHSSPAQRACGRNPIIGHELKVSRSDYRRELLKPDKRQRAIVLCHEFYFVTPAGLLTADEKAYVEPEHFEGQAFERQRCPAKCLKPDRYGRRARGTKAGQLVEVPVAYGDTYCRVSDKLYEPRLASGEAVHQGQEVADYMRRAKAHAWVVCETCEGRGYLRKSVVELEAPTLWIPRDVGLIEVDGRGCHVVRKSPVNDNPVKNWAIADIVRWTSIRPDPRHHPVDVKAVA